jgi:hypothetical protein
VGGADCRDVRGRYLGKPLFRPSNHRGLTTSSSRYSREMVELAYPVASTDIGKSLQHRGAAIGSPVEDHASLKLSQGSKYRNDQLAMR